MKALIVSSLIGLGLLACDISPAKASAVASDTLEARLRNIVTHRPHHGLPYFIAMSFDSTALPLLTGWFQDNAFKPHYPVIVTLLGYLGGPTQTGLLRDFILTRYSGDIDDIELDGILAAILAMGYISDRDSTALAFLEAATDTAFYRRLPYSNALRGREYFHLLLSKLAINAIGLSARPEAEVVLHRIEGRPPDPSQVANVSDALKGHARLMRLGRKALSESWRSGPASK